MAGDKSVWIQRNYDKQISLGVDTQTQTGQEIYPLRSVQLRYVVNYAQNKLNIVSFKLFGGTSSQGSLVWSDETQGADADYRYSPMSAEENSVTANVCGSSVGSL